MLSNDYMNSYMKQRYARRRDDAIVSLGGVCVICGSDSDLEFDHIDPDTKDFTIARASSFSEERWQNELSKCQLLCHTCHVSKHREDIPCGSAKKYWRGCRCDDCRQANSLHSREYKRQRRSTI